MKVLVVDDSRVMRQIVVRTLRQAGFGDLDIVEAANGAQALDVVPAEVPDLVLSDWNMPEMTGIELLAALRARGDDTPFGFVTSETSAEMRLRADAAGASFLITKPFNADAFAEALGPLLGSACPYTCQMPDETREGAKSETSLMPHLKAVRDLLSDLTGRDIEVKSGADPVGVGGALGSMVGLYVDDLLRSAAVICFDLPLAAYSGAALGLVPVAGAEAAIEDGDLPKNLFENCHEVLDIMASLFNLPDAPHLRLYATYAPDEVLRADVRELAVRQTPREDITVEIGRYGTGTMSVVLA